MAKLSGRQTSNQADNAPEVHVFGGALQQEQNYKVQSCA
jgi:hypothetical protein